MFSYFECINICSLGINGLMGKYTSLRQLYLFLDDFLQRSVPATVCVNNTASLQKVIKK